MGYTFNPLSGTFDIIKDLSGYVPYVGATANVDLGSFDITATDGTFNGDLKLVDDKKLKLNTSGDTYFIFNSATNKLELYVLGVKRGEWR